MTGELTPRAPRPLRARKAPWVALVVALAVAGAVAVLIFNLVEGSLYFYNADEAVEERADIGDKRFTLQGAPIGCSIVEGFRGDEPVVAFSLSFGGAAVDVVHHGDPAELFQPDVPVVLDGVWVEQTPQVEGFAGIASDGWHFSSDRMRVKHDNDYINDEDYDERLTLSDAGADSTGVVCEA